MAEQEHHANPARNWLIFFFVCFGIVLLGIVILFARNVNDQSSAPESGGGHHSMVVRSDRLTA